MTYVFYLVLFVVFATVIDAVSIGLSLDRRTMKKSITVSFIAVLFLGLQELFGYKRTRNLFEELADNNPENIISRLKEEGRKWTNGEDPDDDVTFVVIKVK